MNEYFDVAIRQHQERGRRLLGRIPKPYTLPQEFRPLVDASKTKIGQIIDTLERLATDPQMLKPNYQPERLRRFRRAVQEMSFLETTCVAALERHKENDVFLSQMAAHIISEIAYPLNSPMVSSLSQQYFHIYPYLNLLFMPLTEGDFLLHLPDIYHELAHPIIAEQHDPNIIPFQMRLLEALDIAWSYLAGEMKKEKQGRGGPREFTSYFNIWKKNWIDWGVEFFCDLFAVYTIGPAFGWAHLHLCAEVGDNPYYVPLSSTVTHPADHARMQTILYGLRLTDFDEAADQIEHRWNDLLLISGTDPEPEYRRCFPDHILEQFAQKAYEATLELKCEIASPETKHPIFLMLNEAWDVFWERPNTYIDWERDAVARLRTICSLKVFP